MRVYEPVVRWTLRYRWLVIGGALAVIVVTVPVFLSLGSRPCSLDEGALMYMPTTLPGISIGQAQQLLQATDRIIHQFRKWIGCLASRARGNRHRSGASFDARDRITLKPRSAWRHTDTWYSSWLRSGPGAFSATSRPTRSPPTSWFPDESALKIPGVTNAWTMPIRGRIDMLTTGIRTPVASRSRAPTCSAFRKSRLR